MNEENITLENEDLENNESDNEENESLENNDNDSEIAETGSNDDTENRYFKPVGLRDETLRLLQREWNDIHDEFLSLSLSAHEGQTGFQFTYENVIKMNNLATRMCVIVNIMKTLQTTLKDPNNIVPIPAAQSGVDYEVPTNSQT